MSWQKKSKFGDMGEQRGRKRAATNDSAGSDDSKAAKIMRRMGYREGEGMGIESQGIREPIQVEQRRHRVGLGFDTNTTEENEPVPEKLQWNIEETVEIDETVEWISKLDEEMPTKSILQSWLMTGEKNEIIDNQTNFVDPDILKWILKCKNQLDQFGNNDLFQARSRSNPYETIKKGIFMNRAAMKMANIDCILGFEITNPKSQDGEMLMKDSEKSLLFFADICAGPGGFSEYILWRKRWQAKGFGFTLQGECDFKLQDFISGPPESFEPHYGVAGDGDIYNPRNCKSFIEYVLKHTDGLGVHFVMADGGFSVKGNENNQEILSRQLYLSQAMVALGIIREGGHFICKLFDVFTRFSVGLVYLMRFCFENVALLKPITSRPANSERYLIAKWRKSDVTPIIEYLQECHDQMSTWNCNKANMDILELVPLHRLKDDGPFFEYIKRHNEENGIKQIQNLRKIVEFHFKPSLREENQWNIKCQFLKQWGFASGDVRKSREYCSPEEMLRVIFSNTNTYRFGAVEKTLDKDFTHSSMEKECRSPYNWKICVVENSMYKKLRGFFLSAGCSRIYKFDGISKWELLSHYQKFEMANETLVYGEIVTEYIGEVPNQQKIVNFHIIDGIRLGGKYIGGLSLSERSKWCHAFAKAMNKTHSISKLGAFRAKELVPLENFMMLNQSFKQSLIKERGKVKHLLCPVSLNGEHEDNVPYIEGSGIIFLQEIQDPWLKAYSFSQGQMYYFNSRTNFKDFQLPSHACADFGTTMHNRLFWKWDKDVDLSYPPENETEQKANNKIYSGAIIQWLNEIRSNGIK